MFDRFGEFDSAEEINLTADGLFNEGDFENIKVLAKENGIDEAYAEAFTAGDIPVLCDAMTAAIGKLDMEAAELKPKEIMEDWLDYIKARCAEEEEMAAAVRKKGKSLKGCIAALLVWSFDHQNTVDKDILKEAKVSGARVTLGIPGIGTAKKIITEYYLGKKAV